MPGRRGPGLPVRRGAVLQPAGQPGVSGRRRDGGAGAGRRRPAAADAPGGEGGVRPADGLRPPVPQARVSGEPAGHGGRAEEQLRPAGAAAPGGARAPRPGGGEAAGPGADLRDLSGHDRPDGPGPPGSADPDGGKAEGAPLGPGDGPVAGRLHRLHPPAAGGAAPPAAPGGQPHGHPHLRPSGGGRGGRGDLFSRPPHGGRTAPAGGPGGDTL